MSNIYAYSIDYDGCVMGDRWCGAQIQNLITHMAQTLKKDADGMIVLMVGSFRQSIRMDSYAISVNRNGSCFPLYLALIERFQSLYPNYAKRISFDRLLLADIYEEGRAGSHFEKAIVQYQKGLTHYTNFENTPNPRWHDMTKCGLQYVQMHHLASRFPDDTIFYYFHDNFDIGILIPSYQYFNSRRDVMPENVNHCHHHYEIGEYVKKYKYIKGLGGIDYDYRRTILSFDGTLTGSFKRNLILAGMGRAVGQHRSQSGWDIKTSSVIKERALNADAYRQSIISFNSTPLGSFKRDAILRNAEPMRSSGEIDRLRSELSSSQNSFLFFDKLVQERGWRFSKRFVELTQDQFVYDEYNGFLLHAAIVRGRLQEVGKILKKGADHLFENAEGKTAFECAVATKQRNLILLFTEHARIQTTEKYFLEYVSSLNNDVFFGWVNELIVNHFDRSALILIQFRLGGVLLVNADFARLYIKKYLEMKEGKLQCTQSFLMELTKNLKKPAQANSEFSQNLSRFRFHIAVFPREQLEDSALDALCFFISEFHELKSTLFDAYGANFYTLFFEIVKMTPEISQRMMQVGGSNHERIEHYYRSIVGYHVVVHGYAKEELSDSHKMANQIVKRFVNHEFSSQDIVNHLKERHQDILWDTERDIKTETPREVILKKIRKQKEKNANNTVVQALFVSLQSLVAQVNTWPLVVGFIKQWGNMQANDVSRVSVAQVLRQADDEAGCTCFAFFSPKNERFLQKLPTQIEAVTTL